MREVSGQKDPVMQLLRELHNEKGRRLNGRLFVEGAEMIRRAVDYGAVLRELIVADRLAGTAEGAHLATIAAGAGAGACTASSGLLAKMVGSKPVPDCVAIVDRCVHSLADVLDAPGQLVMMVEKGESVDNLGMLLRSAEAAGASGVVLAGGTADPFCRRAVRGSRGAVFLLQLCIQPDPVAAVDMARERGMCVVATSAIAQSNYAAHDYTCPTMIVVGNEHSGVSEAVRDRADAVVSMPMHGRVHSLNIAVAASVMLYEATRQRGMVDG